MAKQTEIEIPYPGRRHAIRYAMTLAGRMPARDFLLHLDKQARAKMYFLIAALGDQGEIVNEERFRQVSDVIWEMKVHSPGLRLLCFEHAGTWYLTHGCGKLKKKEFRAQIERAERIRGEQLERLGAAR